ncbi:hypothetical protein CK203_101036 [Vitis vinifera]|uniref:Reverse transcriptase zinc-binding domain-containing protein n=1 Tax=Vitis vinifera TaxID=29760 RepID=A0A438FIA9_VITVI|nr:hypothetical protein CK203_101036 [Vitis vinifera]
MLRGHRPSLEEDSVFWRQGRNGQFRVKEAYSLLTNSNDTGFPSRSIWVARVPTKVAFFAWEATWEKREIYPALVLFPAETKNALSYEGDMAVTDVIKFIAGHGSNSHHLMGDNVQY